MAHQLATINDRIAMAYIDATPWHGLGDDVRKILLSLPKEQWIDAILDAAQLRYTVGSVPLYLADGTEVKGHKASVRYGAQGAIDAVFSVVGEGYRHVQNERAVDILRSLVEDFGYVPAAAGALGQGERCWVLLRAADLKITPVDGDDVNGYALLTWGHDGNLSLVFKGTGVRVVCANTLSLAMAGKKTGWITIRHTTSADARIDQAAKLVAGLGAAMKATGDTFAKLARTKLTEAQLVDYIARAIPDTGTKADQVSKVIATRRDTVRQLVTVGKGADLANQLMPAGSVSLWGAYNAVTEYFDHCRTAEAQSAEGLLKAQTSAIFGGNADAKAEALVIAQQLLAGAPVASGVVAA
jgi:phage/plasmid-like protein (TIGR03299 family)